MNKIVKVTKLIDERTVEVTADYSNCAGGCSSCAGCAGTSSVRIMADNSIHARLGDIVMIESDSRYILGLAAVVYLMPALLFAAGTLLSVFAGILGAFVGFCAAFLVGRCSKRKKIATVYITAILEKEKC